MANLTPMVQAERKSLSEFLDTLTPEQWTKPTACTKWNVRALVAHLTAAGNITAPHFFGGFIKTGFNFDKFVEGDLEQFNGGSDAARGEHPAEHLTTLAEFYKKTGAPLRAKKRLEGLKLRATDVDWSAGEGPEVSGPCMSLILGMVGRADALADCAGDGVQTLKSRA